MKYLAQFRYLGTNYIGWQIQPGVEKVSVQSCVETALAKTYKVSSHVSSRTDAGTHALMQWATFNMELDADTTLEKYTQHIRSRLPEDIVLKSLSQVSGENLYPLRNVQYKVYSYFIHFHPDRPVPIYQPYTWYTKQPWDAVLLNDALQKIVGEFDFGCFATQSADKNTIRTIYGIQVTTYSDVRFSLKNGIELGNILPNGTTKSPHVLRMQFKGSGFLKHMIRRIVGTVKPVVVPFYKESYGNQHILSTTVRDGVPGGNAVPSRGLWLEEIQLISP